MNAPTNFEQREAQRFVEESAQLHNLQTALNELIETRAKVGPSKPMATRLLLAEFDFHQANHAYFGTDETLEFLEEAASNLGVDTDGDPVDRNGEPLRTFNPSRVHPDNPSQAGGYS